MKKLLTILCLVLLVSCSDQPPPESPTEPSPEPPPEVLYEVPSHRLIYNGGVPYEIGSNKPFTGISVEHFEHFGGLVTGEERTVYKKGREVSKTVVTFHENGQLWDKVNYKDGKKTGVEVRYYENGQLRSRGNFKNGKELGLWEWFYENGQLRSRGNYKDGEPVGLWERFYFNGQIMTKSNYKEGKPLFSEHYNKKNQLITNGILEDYYENGQLRLRTRIQNRKQNGLYEVFHNNGQLEYKGNYKDGKVNGIWEEFHENGVALPSWCYRNGETVVMSLCEK